MISNKERTLTLQSASPDDNGVYYCCARNAVGFVCSRNNFTLSIIGEQGSVWEPPAIASQGGGQGLLAIGVSVASSLMLKDVNEAMNSNLLRERGREGGSIRYLLTSFYSVEPH